MEGMKFAVMGRKGDAEYTAFGACCKEELRNGVVLEEEGSERGEITGCSCC